MKKRLFNLSPTCARILAFTASTTLFALASPGAEAGDWVGAGGGIRSYDENPWFIGNTTVKYCTRASDNFGVPGSVLGNEVGRALGAWRKWISNNQLDQVNFKITLPDSQPRSLNPQFVPVDSCEEANLEFLFGVRTPEVERYAANYPPRTYAFAQQTARDFEGYTIRSRGFIYFEPPMRSGGGAEFPDYKVMGYLSLRVALLHEIGHVIGLGHVNDTSAMSSHIFEWMTIPDIGERMLMQAAQLDGVTPILPFAAPSLWRVEASQDLDGLRSLVCKLNREQAELASQATVTLFPRNRQPNDIATALGELQIFDNNKNRIASFPLRAEAEIRDRWPACKIRLVWPKAGAAPTTGLNLLSMGCLDPIAGERIVGSVGSVESTRPNSTNRSEVGHVGFEIETLKLTKTHIRFSLRSSGISKAADSSTCAPNDSEWSFPIQLERVGDF